MQKIYIRKKYTDTGSEIFVVPALALKNSENVEKITIPYPAGNSTLEYDSLEKAVGAIINSGFEYVLPDGKELPVKLPVDNMGLYDVLYNKIVDMTKNVNTGIVSSAIQGLSTLGDDRAIKIFIEKMGEDNEAVRMAAINSLVKYKTSVIEQLLTALNDSNWVRRNSAITCILMISENAKVDSEAIVMELIKRIDDGNPIVQANAIIAASKIYEQGFIK